MNDPITIPNHEEIKIVIYFVNKHRYISIKSLYVFANDAHIEQSTDPETDEISRF